MGPRSSAGTNTRSATRITVAIRRITKVGVSVRIVPGEKGETRLPESAPATASAAIIGRKRPKIIAMPPTTFAYEIP